MPKLCKECRRVAVKGRIIVEREGKAAVIILCSQHRAEFLMGKNEYSRSSDSSPSSRGVAKNVRS